MENQNLQPQLRQKANDRLAQLSFSERETLLVKCWMSHDARWFMAVASEYGMTAANRLNQIAAHEVGTVEAKRIVRALQMLPITTLDDYLLAQEIFIALLGPDLIKYRVSKSSDHAYQMHVQSCFAYDNAVRAGIADEYECGIFARLTGWLDALNLAYEMHSSLGKCLKAQGQECLYTISIGSDT